jgi:hypothetical protein
MSPRLHERGIHIVWTAGLLWALSDRRSSAPYPWKTVRRKELISKGGSAMADYGPMTIAVTAILQELFG